MEKPAGPVGWGGGLYRQRLVLLTVRNSDAAVAGSFWPLSWSFWQSRSRYLNGLRTLSSDRLHQLERLRFREAFGDVCEVDGALRVRDVAGSLGHRSPYGQHGADGFRQTLLGRLAPSWLVDVAGQQNLHSLARGGGSTRLRLASFRVQQHLQLERQMVQVREHLIDVRGQRKVVHTAVPELVLAVRQLEQLDDLAQMRGT